ncbi:4Fe-4S binding protein [Draconibacterium sp. IB214405]|uniref:4Fe-4S binding protein n=1 Tax=Draconibacterium sp. IB214405 TaxID=3097352 RepID=UPI002A155B8C|nr:4Fe-4S binding protein [Draconibacterium sp. IB214405]MDX8340000.1 4Fe-4S binding protein [Draconibacterium sp. IB214405]
MKLKTKNTNWPRLIAQWGVVAFILILAFLPDLTKINTPDFEAYCPFGGMQALGSYLLSEALSCTMTSAQIVMGILLFVGVLLFSKLFCSYICPVGTVSEWLGSLGDKLKIRFTIKGLADKLLRSLKYILLFITLYFTLQSNELFCKKFDPYFALASGFNTDVVVQFAIVSILLVVVGSIFIRLFWCKYICPLGAISNIFKFSLFFVVLLLVYIILLNLGITISYVWPLTIACVGGYGLELRSLKSKFTPLAKITRNESTCTSCQLCTKKCPQAIDVASLKTVKHVDCNLCGDCLLVCPVKGTLTINKQPKLKRLPVIATVILVLGGVLLGNVWEVPTIDLKWADHEVIEEASVFTMSGLKNIKCYGSSMAFANQMKRVDGVYGVATFVKHHRVKIYYDDTVLDEEKLQEELFTPQKVVLKTLPADVHQIYAISLQLENFFDSYDFNYLSYVIREKTDAVGMISEFACPVVVKIFFPEEIQDKTKLISLIESESYVMETTAGLQEIEMGYEAAVDPEYFTTTKSDYAKLMFTPFARTFNYRNEYTDDVIADYTLPMGDNGKVRNRLSYLVSHLSNDNGIVAFQTKLDENDKEVIEISYVDTITNIPDINGALLSDSLTITYSSGKTGKVKNMFDFSEEISDQSINK